MTKISHHTFCLTDFETSQTEATLGSHCRRTGFISNTVYISLLEGN